MPDSPSALTPAQRAAIVADELDRVLVELDELEPGTVDGDMVRESLDVRRLCDMVVALEVLERLDREARPVIARHPHDNAFTPVETEELERLNRVDEAAQALLRAFIEAGIYRDDLAGTRLDPLIEPLAVLGRQYPELSA